MKLHFRASLSEAAQKAFRELTQRYGQTHTPRSADVIVSLGGDGATLHALQDSIRFKKPVFGLNLGHVGHFQNLYREDTDLIERIHASKTFELSPLRSEAARIDGSVVSRLAINEAEIFKATGQAIHLRVFINLKFPPRKSKNLNSGKQIA